MAGTLAMPFDNPSTYPGHSGVDFGQPRGKEILASGPGRVSFSGYANDRAGYCTFVYYDAYPGVEIMYAHQGKNTPRPKANARVTYGSYLGAVDSVGINSTGPHLHLEVINGKGAHTYDGVWLYFDKENWIGKEDDDMGKIDDTEENYQTIAGFLARAFKWDVRDGSDKVPPRDSDASKYGMTLWDRFGKVDNNVASINVSADVDEKKLAQELVAQGIQVAIITKPGN